MICYHQGVVHAADDPVSIGTREGGVRLSAPFASLVRLAYPTADHSRDISPSEIISVSSLSRSIERDSQGEP